MGITFDELEIRPGGEEPGRGARRAVAVVGAVALVAVAVAVGYGVGRSSDADEPATAAAETDAGAGASTIAEPAGSAPADEAPGPVETVALGEDVATSYAGSSDAGSEVGRSASGGPGWPVFGAQPLDLLAERTTPSGFVLRAHLGETWDVDFGDDGGVDGWEPAPWCYESGQLRVALAGNGVVDVGSVPWYREPFNGRAVSWVSLGGVDGNPQWVVVVQTPRDATSVTVTFADGGSDSAAPQNGIALLTVPDDSGTPGSDPYAGDPPEFVVDVQGGAAAGVVGSDGTGSWNDPAFRESCQPPPPALPDPGVQPADPVAGEEAITSAMTELYDASVGGERDRYLDDVTGVGEARDQIAEGDYADAAASAAAVVEELVFTSPTEAWFRYRIESSNGTFAPRYGIAVLIDGAWKITRNTVCQDLALAGGDCGEYWEVVQPPSIARGAGSSPVTIGD